MKKHEDPSLIPTDQSGFYVDKRTHAVLNLNLEEKRIYDLQVSLESMRTDMVMLKNYIKSQVK
jgi:hypothetical protein